MDPDPRNSRDGTTADFLSTSICSSADDLNPPSPLEKESLISVLEKAIEISDHWPNLINAGATRPYNGGSLVP